MTDDIYQIPSTTPDLRAGLAEQLSELVPEAITDGKVDVDKLKELLDGDVADSSERFGLFWPGKKRAMRAAQEPTTATLKPDFENSKDWDTTQNVFIEGDNLEVLKVLQKHYHGKINMIYIDPPYNTGKDFVYPDNFKEGLSTYLEWTKQVNEEGKKLSSNREDEGRYHSNWLNMMYPRLKLSRNLLTDDGVIFINIGSGEYAHLKRLCDEIFGESNFIADFIWEKTQHFGRQKVNTYSNYDHVICYARQLISQSGLKKELLIEYQKNEFEDAPLFNRSNPENSLKFPAGSVKFNIPDGRYEVTNDDKYVLENPVLVENGRNVNEFFLRFRSRWSPAKVIEEADKGTQYWVKTKSFAIRAIYAQGKVFNESPREIIFTNSALASVTKSKHGTKVGTNEEGSSEVNKLFGYEAFSYPKPVSLIEYLVSIANAGIVLDFFSGSGTTAHAVMKLNAADGGNRRHIQVQLPEPLEEKHSGKEAGFETISALAMERIRRAGEKIKEDFADKLAERDRPLDVGFRTYKLSDTNFTKWHVVSSTPTNELEQHLLDLRDSANDDASADDLLIELLLKQGHSLTEKIAPVEIAGLELRSINDGLVLAYLHERVKPALDQLRTVAGAKPERLIILEDAFQGDDELKTNLVQICKTNNIELWTA